MKIVQRKAEVLSKKQLNADIYHLSFHAPRIARAAKPGQFINILCGDNQSYILRRPFSIFSVTGGSLAILFKVVGKGTSWLKEAKAGSSLDIIGPLGRGFEIKKSPGPALLISGGIGIAPLRFLAEKLKKRGARVSIVLGACSKSHLPFRHELKRYVEKIYLITEDGTIGEKGLVTEFLPELFKKIEPREAYACGPHPMLKKVAELSSQFKVPCQVSLEKVMGCGLGVCLSCVCAVKVASGNWEYQRVCVEGPVFKSDEVIWDET